MESTGVRKKKYPNQSLLFDQRVDESIKHAEQLIKDSQHAHSLMRRLLEELRQLRARARQLTRKR